MVAQRQRVEFRDRTWDPEQDDRSPERHLNPAPDHRRDPDPDFLIHPVWLVLAPVLGGCMWVAFFLWLF